MTTQSRLRVRVPKIPTSQASLLPLSFKKVILIYTLVSCYRLLNAFILQTQFDPDEYWQTLEPAYCLAFRNYTDTSGISGSNCAYTWEWTRNHTTSLTIGVVSDNVNVNVNESDSNNHMLTTILQKAFHGPVRSHVSILPTYWFYKLLQFYSSFFGKAITTYMVAHGPVFINALLVAAPTDVAVYCIARWISCHSSSSSNNDSGNAKTDANGSDNDGSIIPLLALLASVTNWFHGYSLVRTYSNSMETMLLTLGIALLSPELFGSVDNLNKRSIRLMAKIAFVIGGIGVAIRFTSLAAWIPIGLIISFRQERHHIFYYLFNLCALCGALGLFIGCAIDWYFYDSIGVVPFLGNFHFNVMLGNGSLYGTHPPYWYIVAGLPAIAGVLLPFFIYECYSIIKSKICKQINKSNDLVSTTTTSTANETNKMNWCPKVTLIIIIASYISFHSISSHKEFRFISPILPLVCILSSCAMNSFLSKRGEDEEGGTAKRSLASSTSTSRSILLRRKIILGLLVFILNYPHLIYLSMVHQRSPISVNQSIAKYMHNLNELELEMEMEMGLQDDNHSHHQYSIHYLMGCHSTPLFSHLYVPSTLIDTWTLDCSPHCRKDSSCESDLFISNPYRFISQSYHNVDDECVVLGNDDNNKTCQNHYVKVDDEEEEKDQTQRRQIPDFLVIFETELSFEDVQDYIVNDMGLFEITKFRHGIKGIDIVPTNMNKLLPNISWSEKGSLQINGGFDSSRAIELSFDHMVLFAKKNETL